MGGPRDTRARRLGPTSRLRMSSVERGGGTGHGQTAWVKRVSGVVNPGKGAVNQSSAGEDQTRRSIGNRARIRGAGAGSRISEVWGTVASAREGDVEAKL